MYVYIYIYINIYICIYIYIHTNINIHTYLSLSLSLSLDHLGGLVVKTSALRAEDPGFASRLRRDFSGWSHTSDLKIGTQVATRAPFVIGSALGLVGPVSVYRDWMGRKFDLQLLSQCGST